MVPILDKPRPTCLLFWSVFVFVAGLPDIFLGAAATWKQNNTYKMEYSGLGRGLAYSILILLPYPWVDFSSLGKGILSGKGLC